MLEKIWNQLSYLGLEGEHELAEKREIVLMNRVLMVSFVLFIPMIIVSFIVGETNAALRFVVQVILLLFCLYVNSRKWFNFSKAFLYLACLGMISVTGVLMGKEYPNEFILLLVIPLVLILFKNKYVVYFLSIFTVIIFFLIIHLKEVVPTMIFIAPENKSIIDPIVFFMLFGIIFFEVYYFASLNKQYENQLLDQKKEIQQKQEEIVQSINYSRHLQNALLPSPASFQQALPESFILFKPKDIVSGDFYWLHQNENQIMVAVGDCTGHGVPGAMISLLAVNSINRCVKEFNLTEPAAILNKANGLFTENFGSNESTINDGMDISLVSLKYVSSNVKAASIAVNWAGANNPLWIVKKPPQEENTKAGCEEPKPELQEVQPDKQPIGKFDGHKSFKNHEIELKKGDMIYLFSDGFADQFGGPKGKKFSKSQFRELILKIASLPITEQKTVLETSFFQWKGELEQLDDVCIAGIKV